MGQVIAFPGLKRARIPVEQCQHPDSELALAEARLGDALRHKLESRGVELPEIAIEQLVRGLARELGYA